MHAHIPNNNDTNNAGLNNSLCSLRACALVVLLPPSSLFNVLCALLLVSSMEPGYVDDTDRFFAQPLNTLQALYSSDKV